MAGCGNRWKSALLLSELTSSQTCGIMQIHNSIAPKRHSYPERRRDRPDDASTTSCSPVLDPLKGVQRGAKSDREYLGDERAAELFLCAMPFQFDRKGHFLYKEIAHL